MSKIKIVAMGDVQGVGFRFTALEKAGELGLTLEKAENMSDGSVVLIVGGGEDALQKFIAWAKMGPRFAKVNGIAIKKL